MIDSHGIARHLMVHAKQACDVAEDSSRSDAERQIQATLATAYYNFAGLLMVAPELFDDLPEATEGL